MKIAATALASTPDSTFDSRFGRTPFILVYDTVTDSWQTLDNAANASAQSGAGIGATQLVAGIGAQILVTGHVGPKAEQALSAAGIEVRLGEFETPQDAVASVAHD
jgi:predicted Fe-Mo cluster-binding NifX family protein